MMNAECGIRNGGRRRMLRTSRAEGGWWRVREGRVCSRAFLDCGLDDGEVGEVVAVIPPVSGQQAAGVTSGMRSDEKIRKDTLRLTISAEVVAIHFAGQDGRFPRGRSKKDIPIGQERTQIILGQRRSDLGQPIFPNHQRSAAERPAGRTPLPRQAEIGFS
jgi:hypothetical protein